MRLFKVEVKWCGRVISWDGYQIDPRKIMDFPVAADEPCQFLHCCWWMLTCIPDFHRMSQPLRELLEAAYAQEGKRRKAALKKIPLSNLSWGAMNETASTDLKETLKTAVEMSHLIEHYAKNIFTVPSDRI